MKRVEVADAGEGRCALRFYCAGCVSFHLVPTKLLADEAGETYDWNGSVDRPTLVPTFRAADRCTVSVRDGWLYYAMSCTHGLRGRAVPMAAVVAFA